MPSLFLSKVCSRSRRQKARKNMGLDMNYEAEVFVDTENLSREDWLSFRRKGIGGSHHGNVAVLYEARPVL